MLETKDTTSKLFFRERPIRFKSRTSEARVKIPEMITLNKMVILKSLLLGKINNFRGGQLEKHVRQWKN